jgi:hypothetical protein
LTAVITTFGALIATYVLVRQNYFTNLRTSIEYSHHLADNAKDEARRSLAEASDAKKLAEEQRAEAARISDKAKKSVEDSTKRETEATRTALQAEGQLQNAYRGQLVASGLPSTLYDFLPKLRALSVKQHTFGGLNWVRAPIEKLEVDLFISNAVEALKPLPPTLTDLSLDFTSDVSELDFREVPQLQGLRHLHLTFANPVRLLGLDTLRALETLSITVTSDDHRKIVLSCAFDANIRPPARFESALLRDQRFNAVVNPKSIVGLAILDPLDPTASDTTSDPQTRFSYSVESFSAGLGNLQELALSLPWQNIDLKGLEKIERLKRLSLHGAMVTGLDRLTTMHQSLESLSIEGAFEEPKGTIGVRDLSFKVSTTFGRDWGKLLNHFRPTNGLFVDFSWPENWNDLIDPWERASSSRAAYDGAYDDGLVASHAVIKFARSLSSLKYLELPVGFDRSQSGRDSLQPIEGLVALAGLESLTLKEILAGYDFKADLATIGAPQQIISLDVRIPLQSLNGIDEFDHLENLRVLALDSNAVRKFSGLSTLRRLAISKISFNALHTSGRLEELELDQLGEVDLRQSHVNRLTIHHVGSNLADLPPGLALTIGTPESDH